MGLPVLLIYFSFLVGCGYAEVRNFDFEMLSTDGVALLTLDEEHFADGALECASTCSKSSGDCHNFLYDEASKVCTLGYWLLPTVALNKTITHPSSSYMFSRGKFCDVKEVVTPSGNGRMSSCNTAACIGSINLATTDSYIPNTQNVYKSCNDLRNTTNPRQLLQLPSGLIVMCDTATDGGGWTIFQRRISGLVDFYRNWTTYRDGFGDYDIGNFYLGNENIYCLTSNEKHELRVDITFKGKQYYATYSTFKILNESMSYMLYVAGYNGNATDAMIPHSSQKFSTYDKNKVDCARDFHGGWWYIGCHVSHLNGVWGNTLYGMGLNWVPLTSYYEVVTSSEMKMRPT